MGRKLYLGIIYFITIVCIIIGSSVHIFNFMENTFLDNLSSKLSGAGSIVEHSEDLSSTAFSEIQLDMSVMSVTIEKGNSYTISYHCPEKLVPTYEVKDNILYVSQTKNVTWNNSSKKCSMTITIPADVEPYPVITGQIDVGSFYMEDMAASSLDITADVGDIEISDVQSDSTKITADVGDVSLTDVTSSSLILKADVGDVDLERCSFGTLDVQSDVGDVDVINIPDKQEEFHFDVATDLGDIEVNGIDYKDEYKANSDASKSIFIQVSTGDVDVSFR